MTFSMANTRQFQHTAARRRLGLDSGRSAIVGTFQHTAARRRLAQGSNNGGFNMSFNTQPPEGGWKTPRQAKATT